MAFDSTYLTAGLNQLMLRDRHVLVGGAWTPTNPENAFIPLDQGDEEDEQIDIKNVRKSTQMMEFLAWDASMDRKIPLPMCTLPVEINFSGAHATQRAGMYHLELVGKVLESSGGCVKAVVFDAASAHQLLRKVVHGQFEDVPADQAFAEIPFFSRAKHFAMPECVLPRLPIQQCQVDGDWFWALPGVCHWVGILVAFGQPGSSYQYKKTGYKGISRNTPPPPLQKAEVRYR